MSLSRIKDLPNALSPGKYFSAADLLIAMVFGSAKTPSGFPSKSGVPNTLKKSLLAQITLFSLMF